MLTENLQSLMKALEAGSYNAAPSTLTQGAALQVEDLSNVMHNLTFNDSHIKFQKSDLIGVASAKSQLVQFNRQLSYGIFGGSAQFEGGIGETDVSSFARVVVPMSYYSTIRRVTIAANMIQRFDGLKSEDAEAENAAKKLAGDIEFDIAQGQAHFSNAGVFDGSPAALAASPSIKGFDVQIRESDDLSIAKDLMFSEFGSNQSVLLVADGALTQGLLEDAAVKSAMNMGNADTFFADPIVISQYNKIAFPKERIILAGSPQESSGAMLRLQHTSSGPVKIEGSRFLSGKTAPALSREGSPAAPSVSGAPFSSAASKLTAGVYQYKVTAVNIRGESVFSSTVSVTIAAGQGARLTITPVSGALYYNVYRSLVGGSASSVKFIGRVAQKIGNAIFDDIGNRSPGFVNGYLLEKQTMKLYELAPYSRLKLAVSDLSMPEAHFRFLCLAAFAPRKNVIIDNLTGQIS